MFMLYRYAVEEKKRNKMKTFKEFVKEEVPVNNAGGGQVAGIGVGAQGEPGIKKKKQNILFYIRRKKVK